MQLPVQLRSQKKRNLIHSVDNWYKEHYTAQVVIQDLHTRVVLVRGEPFQVRIPTIFNAFGALDVLEYVLNLSPSLLRVLDEKEKRQLQERFNMFYTETSNILLCQTRAKASGSKLVSDLLSTGWADLKSCGVGFNPQDPAAALFPAQHAVEKYLKAFLVSQDACLNGNMLRRTYGHSVAKLRAACASRTPVFQQVMPYADRLSYTQEVRYERPKLSLAEIIDRIDLSHAICKLVATLLIRTRGSERDG